MTAAKLTIKELFQLFLLFLLKGFGEQKKIVSLPSNFDNK